MGKQELKKKIFELNRTAKNKFDIYNELEPEVAEKQKHWLVQQILSVVNPELIKKYKPFNHALLLMLIVQYLFSFYFFWGSGSQFNINQISLVSIATTLYLLLMFGIYRIKLIAYNTLIVLCAVNIVFSLFTLLSSSWLDLVISDAVNIGQIIFVIWLQNRLFPEMRVLRSQKKRNRKKILSNI